MEIANFSIGKGPPCEYFQQILEVSFDFSAIFRKKYKGPLFENTKRGVLGYFHWNCKILKVSNNILREYPYKISENCLSIYFQRVPPVNIFNRFWKCQKYKGPLFENTKRGVLGYFRWNCKILKVSKNIQREYPCKISENSEKAVDFRC